MTKCSSGGKPGTANSCLIMLNSILKWSIARRWWVILGAITVTVWISGSLIQMPLDVLPAFAPPQVEIQTETPGLAPEEVESLVTLPIESAINGTPGVTTVRSASAAGVSVVKVTFSWNTDPYQARQRITERLQPVQGKLPQGVGTPQLSPITSPISTIVQYAFTSDTTSLMEVRRLVDWQITNHLLAIPGVSQVVVYGGEQRQYQVLIEPNKLQAFDVSLQQVVEAVKGANRNAPGGYLITTDSEKLIRGLGRVESLADLQQSVVTARHGQAVHLSDVATVQIGAALKRGDGSLNGQKAVIVLVNKQPLADTPTVTQAIEQAMTKLKAVLPQDIQIATTFRQEDYIDASIDNVRSALVEGAIIVALILIPFLMNWRSLLICLVALPLSLLLGVMALYALGQGLNTMTLGGLAVAIGSAVDDAIVDAENVYRELRENKHSPQPRPVLDIVLQGCQDVRDSVFGATLITVVVFSPVFALGGVEGSIFIPMGIGYIVAVLASSLTALTITPALCAILLPYGYLPEQEPKVAQFCKQLYQPFLSLALYRSRLVLAIAGGVTVIACILAPHLGREFLPEFQERMLVNSIMLYPGSSLTATNTAGGAIELALRDDPRFASIQTRSGRAPGDADAAGVNVAHVDVALSDLGMQQRSASIAHLRQELAKLPGVAANVGGFISHRMDEVLSGVRSAIAVKIFGPDLAQLQQIGQQVEQQMRSVPGVVDLLLEPQIPIEQIQIQFNRAAANRYGLTVGQLSEVVETALNGQTVSQVLDQQQTFDLVVWLQPTARNNLDTIGRLLVDTPSGQKIPLAQVATITTGTGPNTINRENVSRLIVVSANVSGRDLRSIVHDIQAKVNQNTQLPPGYYIQYGGQHEAEERSTQRLLLFSGIAAVLITLLMYLSVKSLPSTTMIMINLPLALVGGVFAIALTGGVISVASLVGFITLFGIATRNGLLLVDNYNTRFAAGMPLKEVIIQGSMERLNAILMTAFTSALGLAPLVVASGPGKELLQPLSIVVLGGLITSTALTLMVLPALYSCLGRYLFPPRPTSQTQNSPSLGAGEIIQDLV